jgi:hypothetical protein
MKSVHIHLSCYLLIYLKISNISNFSGGGNSMIIIHVFGNVVARDGGAPNRSVRTRAVSSRG